MKNHGWELHHDQNARVAAYGIETDEYRALLATPDVKAIAGMRSRR